MNSFEHEFGTRWKQLHELFKQKQEALKRELQMEFDKLEAQEQFARYEHETELLRERMRKFPYFYWVFDLSKKQNSNSYRQISLEIWLIVDFS